LPSGPRAAGRNESTVISTAFGTPLDARITDAAGNPLSGVGVTFAILRDPGSGATGTFEGLQTNVAEVTNFHGIAHAARLTANGRVGAFKVTASVNGVEGLAAFHLINVAHLLSPRRCWEHWCQSLSPAVKSRVNSTLDRKSPDFCLDLRRRLRLKRDYMRFDNSPCS
jgi:hypothetical protein